ncbi:amino acid ABC transporter permease [Eubacterium xylanophilum]|uniref:amino acid ABC transporter permease n=1 Tax=Eubacterium xylanophilum TaxID=39497 RepID=UPI0004AF684D|nr:amino acid ABC transporter permease [Eubacterium xylanophilum]
MLDFEKMKEAFPELIKFLPVTIQLTLGTLAIALPVSVLFSLILLGKRKVPKAIVRFILSIIRGTPVLLQLFVIYAALPFLIENISSRLKLNVDVYSIDNKWYAYFALSLSAVAFLTEAFRSAIASVDRGQSEAGYMVGLSNRQVFRRIVLPQAMVIAVPVCGNIVVDVIKTTSLAFTISVTEVMGEAKILGGMNTRYLDMFFDVFIIYLVFIGLVEYMMKLLEKRLVRYRTREEK